MKPRIAQIIIGLAEYYDKTLSESQISMYVDDLESLQPQELEAAVLLYRKDSKNDRFPLPAKLKEIVQSFDGRPGAEEAWSIVPKSEHDAAYVNEEMMAAWSAANDLILDGGDMVSARMVFKEVYERKVKDNRNNKINPRWWLTRASGKGAELLNEDAMRIAVDKKRVTLPDAVKLLPSFTLSKKQSETSGLDIKQLINKTMKGIE